MANPLLPRTAESFSMEKKLKSRQHDRLMLFTLHKMLTPVASLSLHVFAI